MRSEGSYDASRRSLSRFCSPQGVRARRRGARDTASGKLVGNRGSRNLCSPGALAQWRRQACPALRQKKRQPVLRPLSRKSRVRAGARRDCQGPPSRGGGERPLASCGRARTTTRFRASGTCGAGTRSSPRRRSQGRRVRQRGAQKKGLPRLLRRVFLRRSRQRAASGMRRKTAQSWGRNARAPGLDGPMLRSCSQRCAARKSSSPRLAKPEMPRAARAAKQTNGEHRKPGRGKRGGLR